MAIEWRRIKKSTLDAIGNAIRGKTGKTALIPPEDMPTEIENIETGGGGIDPADLPQALQDAGIKATLRYGSGQSYDIIVTGDELEEREFYFNSGTSTVVKSIQFLGSPSVIPSMYIYGQDVLKEIIIPESVRSVAGSAFYSCNNLEKVKFLSSTLNLSDSVFGECAALNSIGTGSQYDIELAEGIKVFPNMRQANYLEVAVIPEGVTQFISFTQCTNLRTLSTPSTLKTAGSLYNCSSLTEINFPEVTNSFSMELCTALQTVHLPKVQQIANCSGMFRGDTALQTVQIGSVGFPITGSRSDWFTNDTQSNLTITLYGSGAHSIDAVVANVRNGARNATIIVKAAANMEYKGIQYQPDDVVLTSTS